MIWLGALFCVPLMVYDKVTIMLTTNAFIQESRHNTLDIL